MTSISTDRRLSVNSGIAIKVPCKVATTANITLSGEQTIDGVACTTNDRVLVKNQSTGSENGIYTVDTGAWSRAVDFDGIYDCTQGTLVNVISGTANANIMFGLTTANPVIGTSSLTFVSIFDTTNGNIYSQGAPTDISSAGTTDIGSVNSCFLKVTGVNAITSFGTNYNGPRILRFDGALVLTHNATTLILPGAVNITTVAGDTCVVVPKSTTSGTADGWVVVSYQRTPSRGSVAMHATTMDLWAEPKIIDGTGSSVTITDIADAPQAGVTRTLYPVAGTVITDGATFDVDGGANYTTSAGDALIFEAVTTSTFKVHIVKADGTAVIADTANQIQPVATPTLNSNAMTIPGVAFSLDFRNATLATGGVTRVSGTPANLVVPAGATLGTQNNIKATLYDIVLLNGSTMERAIVNNTGGVRLDEKGVISTTAIGTGSDSANVIYSNSARSNVPYRVVGRYESTQSTAGNWATAISLVQGMGGQVAVDEVGAMTTMTTSIGTDYTNIGKRVLATFSGLGQLGTACQIGITINGVGPYEIAVAYAGGSATGYWNAHVFLPPNARWRLSAISGSPSSTVSAFYQIVD